MMSKLQPAAALDNPLTPRVWTLILWAFLQLWRLPVNRSLKRKSYFRSLRSRPRRRTPAPMTTADPNDNSVDGSERGVWGAGTVAGTPETCAETNAGPMSTDMQTKHAFKYSDLVTVLSCVSFT
jgi:hypothetical protein